MEDGIIYTFGSLDTLVLVLEGLAILFDPAANQFFSSGSGLGVGVGGTLAAMLALLGTIGNYVTQQKLPVHGPLVGLIIYAVIAVPKVDRVFVSDLYTGETVAVSDVPLGVAVIGIGMSTITYNIIQLTEASYATATVGGTPFESGLTQQNGFLSPMKTLYKLRENIMPAAPDHLVYNIFSYSKYCLYPSHDEPNGDGDPRDRSEKFDSNVFRTSTSPFTTYYLNEELIAPNLMSQYMNPTTGTESFQRCSDVRDTLTADANGGIAYFLDDGDTFGEYLLTQLSTTDEAMLSKCAHDGTCLDGATAITSTEQLVGQILGGVAQAKTYMETRMAADFNKLIITSPSLNSDSLSNYASITREAIESVRMAEVLEGETFLRFMVPAMNFILFIFYAMFPIAMIIMITKGVESFKYLAGYLLIGIWGYSWMPVASVINFITISSIAESLGATRNMLGLNVASSPEMIELAMDQLSTGANLLAATPVITLAIISGALYPLTSVAANSATPKGATGDIAKSNIAKSHTGQSLVETNSQYTDGFGIKGGDARSRIADQIGGFQGISMSNTLSQTASSLRQDLASSTQEWNAAYQNTVGKAKKEIASFTASNGKESLSSETQAFTDAGKNLLEIAGIDTSKMTDSNSLQYMHSAGLNLYAGLEGSADLGKIRQQALDAGMPSKKVDPVMRGSQSTTSGTPSTNANAAPSGTPSTISPDGQVANSPGAIPPASSGVPGVGANGRLGGLGNLDNRVSVTDKNTNEDGTASQIRALVSDESTTTSTSADAESIRQGLDNTFGQTKEGSVQNLRQLAKQMKEDSRQLDAYSDEANRQSQTGTSLNMSRSDMYTAAQNHFRSNPLSGSVGGHYESLVKDELRKTLGDEDQVQAAWEFFDGVNSNHAQLMYGDGDASNAKFMAAMDTMGIASSLSQSKNAQGSFVLGSGEADENMRDAFAAAEMKQYDFLNPNPSQSGNNFSSRVNSADNQINTAAENPNFLTEEQHAENGQIKGDVEQAIAPIKNYSASGVLNAVEGAYTKSTNNATYADLESSGIDNTFQNGYSGKAQSNSPVVDANGNGPSNFKDAYLNNNARDAYANAMFNQDGSSPKPVTFDSLSAEQQGQVSQRQYGDALNHVNAFNQETYGSDAPQFSLSDLPLPSSTGDVGVFESTAASLLNYAANASQNGATATHASKQTGEEAQAAKNQSALNRATQKTDNDFWGNTHGGSGSEYAELMHTAFSSDITPTQWNEHVEGMRSESIANPTKIEGGATRNPAATNDFYDQMKIQNPEGFSGSISQHLAQRMSQFDVLQEDDSWWGGTADAWQNIVTSGSFSNPTNLESGQYGGYDSNYSPLGVSKLFDSAFLNSTNSRIEASSLSDTQKNDLKTEVFQAYNRESTLMGQITSENKAPMVESVNALLKERGIDPR